MWITDTCKAIVLSFVAVFHSPTLPSDGPHQDVLSFTHNKPAPKYPHFPAPNGPDQKGVEFHCKYPELKGWENCTSKDDRSCWLKGPYGQVFNIDTDYENFYPEGIVREVCDLCCLWWGWLTGIVSSQCHEPRHQRRRRQQSLRQSFQQPIPRSLDPSLLGRHHKGNSPQQPSLQRHNNPLARSPPTRILRNGRRKWRNAMSHRTRRQLHIYLPCSTVRHELVS